jgi:uncharacterized membrane protein YkoI
MFAGTAAIVLMVSAAAAFAVPRNFFARPANSVELAASKAGQGSLSRAIAAAENLTGGRVIEIHFDGANGAARYVATVSRNGSVDQALVNLATGQVAIIDQAQEPVRTFDYKAKAESEIVVRGSKIAISDAVASAEQHSRGVAISARTTRSGDGYMVAHDVETVRGEMLSPVLVDAKTGLVIQDNQAFASSEP